MFPPPAGHPGFHLERVRRLLGCCSGWVSAGAYGWCVCVLCVDGALMQGARALIWEEVCLVLCAFVWGAHCGAQAAARSHLCINWSLGCGGCAPTVLGEASGTRSWWSLLLQYFDDCMMVGCMGSLRCTFLFSVRPFARHSRWGVIRVAHPMLAIHLTAIGLQTHFSRTAVGNRCVYRRSSVVVVVWSQYASFCLQLSLHFMCFADVGRLAMRLVRDG